MDGIIIGYRVIFQIRAFVLISKGKLSHYNVMVEICTELCNMNIINVLSFHDSSLYK
jgi:hypothetical protein